MKKILLISPISIAGELIISGFDFGFRAKNWRTLKKDIRELTQLDIDNFKPDIVFGYDYSHLTSPKVFNFNNAKLIHYFGDEPQSKFALAENPNLYEQLKTQENTQIFIWDESFTNDFKGAKYLPLGINPIDYNAQYDGYNHAISFVGRPLTPKRQEILCLLIKEFKTKLSIFCYKPHFEQSLKEIREKNLLTGIDLYNYEQSYKGFITSPKELSKIYNASKINLNITEQGKTGLNYRVFEVLASGAFLLTDDMSDIRKYFEPSKDLEIYLNNFDLIDKINFYLNNFDISYKIGLNGRIKCVKEHNFIERVEKILEEGNNE